MAKDNLKPDHKLGLSVVVPAYNEAAAIRAVVEDLDRTLRTDGATFEIIVVDDGSTDSTPDVLSELRETKPNLHLITHAENQGVGKAMAAGSQAAGLPLTAIFDGDGQFRAEDLLSLWGLASGKRCVLGVRVSRADTHYRRFLGRLGNALAQRIVGARILDVNCGLKIFRTDELRAIHLQSTGGFINAEILRSLRLSTDDLCQVTVTHRPRLSGRATGGSPKVIFGIIRDGLRTIRTRRLIGERSNAAT